MKKKLFYLLALSVSFGLVVSCNKALEEEMEVQETPDLETIISDNLVGTYSGELNVTVNETPVDPIKQEVSVAKGEGESITLSITNFSFGELPVGDVVLENYVVTANEDGTYSFTGESTLTLLEETLNIEAEISATGTFTLGDTVSLSLNLDIDALGGEMKVTVTYNGTKSVSATTTSVIAYDFEDWTTDTTQSHEDYQYPMIDDTDWASSNQAIMLIKSIGVVADITYNGDWPVASTTDAYSGDYALSIESVFTTGGTISDWGVTIPKVTAGSAFMGSFNAWSAITNPLSTTSFGVVVEYKPITVSGYYKYTPGDTYYNADGEEQSDVTDECAISAVLYEVDSESETLDGSNIYTSDKIVASAYLTSGEQTEYTAFNLDLDYIKDYDDTKMYKFTIIFSSSKDGDSYNAASGSKLIVDEVRITCE